MAVFVEAFRNIGFQFDEDFAVQVDNTNNPYFNINQTQHDAPNHRSRPQRNSDNLDEIYQAAGLSEYQRQYLPRNLTRRTKISDLNKDEKRRMLKVFEHCISAVAELFLPGDPKGLIRERDEKNLDKDVVCQKVVQGIKASKKGSTERRVLYACLCSCFPCSRVAELLNNGHEYDNDEGNEEGEAIYLSGINENYEDNELETEIANNGRESINNRSKRRRQSYFEIDGEASGSDVNKKKRERKSH